ncbi:MULTISPECIES: AraC family transcriptional regulator [Pseudonocardia]|uniref:Transcriptional activator FeaR n=2 Tax=Pseudonocardia TaxID=1847 RepID=A0A1Y2N128_PSEAH|nr:MULTISPECIES: helix-turn-helix domain-containing protein [Pseudonocardia]OSY41184.1 Transcriptional activator FeaR [Pseudonocardia autotrophica]TDN76640.1 AraC family transcriptional regulator [Pseudonocardia autotrophica]BBG00640.1 AraC family transcriptional regulator [Pseudonocardia autotrophica]GEC28006.1 AraC family transcriptional regulator [Pseudonocardia saturnea]
MVESRGHLNPGGPDVALSRFPIGLDELVRWAWVARWDVPPGCTRPQRVLQYPAFNLVTGPAGAYLHGPRRVVDVRELTGRSWVVGVLLRPAATPLLSATPAAALRGSSEPSPGAPVAVLSAAVHDAADPDRAVAEALRRWLAPAASRIGDAGRLVNRACALAEERTDVVRADQLAEELGVPLRTLERLVRSHIGLTPLWLIECRRLQHAATALRVDPDTDLAALAADLGYADQAHFTRRYRAVVGETPGATRRAARAGR